MASTSENFSEIFDDFDLRLQQHAVEMEENRLRSPGLHSEIDRLDDLGVREIEKRRAEFASHGTIRKFMQKLRRS